MDTKLKSYKKESEYSYTFGAFPTIELLSHRPEVVRKVLINSKFDEGIMRENIYNICKRNNIEILMDDKLFNKLSPKENCYVIGVFDKFSSCLEKDKPHIVLVNPNNQGNLGTIIRTIVGFGINNLAIIRPGVDIFDPKVLRSSMGAFFSLNFSYYESFTDYMKSYSNHKIYTFMLKGKPVLESLKADESTPFSLVFGNEASGLSEDFSNYGTSIRIPHLNTIDSLNLPLAVGIATYKFFVNFTEC